jgi:hypothetical protein
MFPRGCQESRKGRWKETEEDRQKDGVERRHNRCRAGDRRFKWIPESALRQQIPGDHRHLKSAAESEANRIKQLKDADPER